MSNLESTRTGWFFCALGVFLILLAIGLTVWDVHAGNAVAAPINIITLAAGITNIYFGRKQIRNARAHHQFMENHRAEMARLTARWPS